MLPPSDFARDTPGRTIPLIIDPNKALAHACYAKRKSVEPDLHRTKYPTHEHVVDVE